MAKVKEAAQWISDAIETACGWALLALTLYVLIFTNLTGDGSAWDSLRGVARDVVPVSRVSLLAHEAEAARDRILIVVGGSDHAASVARNPARSSAAMTDAPAGRAVGGDWKAHLTGTLRSFEVYGQGEQTTSAFVPAKTASAASSARAAAPVAQASVPGSAYSAGAAAGARPGIGTRVARVAAVPADSVRNIAGR